MSLTLLCGTSGINGGTIDCPIVPGVAKYLVAWGGKLTSAKLAAGYATCKASLIADSKRSKLDGGKLVVFPIVRDITPKTAANTEAKLADGYFQVTQEGLPAYDFKIVTDLYLSTQLRKLNNKNIRYAIVDSKLQFLCFVNASGDMLGRQGKLFVSGIDVHGYATVDGECNVSLSALSVNETFDNPACIQLDSNPENIFAYLKDIQLKQMAAATSGANTAPTRTATITALGANGDTIAIPVGSLPNVVVAQTSSETTPSLLAAKWVAAFNAANPSVTPATAASAVITITGPLTFGATYNTINDAPVIVGTITATSTAWAGGVTGISTLHISGFISSPNPNVVLDFYSDYSASALGTTASLWYVKNLTTKVVTAPVSVATNVLGYFDVNIGGVGSGSYEVGTVTPDLLDAALVLGIEGNPLIFVKP